MTDLDMLAVEMTEAELLLAIYHRLHEERPAFAVGVPAATGFSPVVGGAFILVGYSVQCGAAAGGFALIDGGNSSFPLITENLAATGTITRHLGPDGIEVNSGLNFSANASMVSGSIWLRHRRRAQRTDR